MNPIDQHERVALQFSGGKDSLAVAHMLRPYWPKITFYHVDTGDLLPEVREIVDGMEAQVPRFVRIRTDSTKWHADNALPSDLVPVTSTAPGLLLGISTQRIVDRFECCANNIMAPMHYRMVEDGVTLVIRGTKRADFPTIPAVSGQFEKYYLWLPLQEWSHDEVFAYLKEVGAPICRVYEHKVNSPECATCTAFWSEGRAEYLKKYHPELYATYQAKLAVVAREVSPHWEALQVELK